MSTASISITHLRSSLRSLQVSSLPITSSADTMKKVAKSNKAASKKAMAKPNPEKKRGRATRTTEKKKQQRWTLEQNRTILEMKSDPRYSWADIMPLVGRDTELACRVQYCKMRAMSISPSFPAELKALRLGLPEDDVATTLSTKVMKADGLSLSEDNESAPGMLSAMGDDEMLDDDGVDSEMLDGSKIDDQTEQDISSASEHREQHYPNNIAIDDCTVLVANDRVSEPSNNAEATASFPRMVRGPWLLTAGPRRDNVDVEAGSYQTEIPQPSQEDIDAGARLVEREERSPKEMDGAMGLLSLGKGAVLLPKTHAPEVGDQYDLFNATRMAEFYLAYVQG